MVELAHNDPWTVSADRETDGTDYITSTTGAQVKNWALQKLVPYQYNSLYTHIGHPSKECNLVPTCLLGCIERFFIPPPQLQKIYFALYDTPSG